MYTINLKLAKMELQICQTDPYFVVYALLHSTYLCHICPIALINQSKVKTSFACSPKSPLFLEQRFRFFLVVKRAAFEKNCCCLKL